MVRDVEMGTERRKRKRKYGDKEEGKREENIAI